ncbi:MAG: carbohydrate binding family 9 domain-containing protein [Ignavibacteriales bacterium]|nr:carbohydrate binding family 9 domain-containing protein [Ignavibacteriales bacterium]
MISRILVAVLLILLYAASLHAGSGSKRINAVRTGVAPRIDGLLNEPEWQLARPVADFLQLDPQEGSPPSQPTEIRILFDNEALYIGARLFDDNPAGIVARLARRDDEVESDWISVRIDSYHDHQTAFEFTLNAAGVKTDILLYNDGREEDPSWDAVWDAEAVLTSNGWSAEFKIPFKVLRFSDDQSQEWGVQFIRYISRLREVQHWVLIGKSESGFVSKFGHLVGLENISRPGHVELLPYVVGGSRFLPATSAFPTGRNLESNVGLDVKLKPSSGLTIDATLNPDFGQVEADPAVLNLSTYETFYPEKRPFFVEGSQILRFTTLGGEFGPGLFYSRRIGRAIRVEAPPGGHVEKEPRVAAILGAAKISGKTADGLSVGALEAVTREERATLVDSLGNKSHQIVEPLTNYSLLRLRKDVLGNSNAGFMLTSVNRKGKLPGMTSGLDWNLKFLESEYRIDGFLAGSRTSDPGGSRIDGSAGKIGFNKDGGAHWRGYLQVDFTSKNYNINDIGFFRRPNDYGFVGQVLYRDDRVVEWKRIVNLSIQYHLRRNFDGAELFNAVGVAGYLMSPGYWEFGVQAERDGGLHDDRETRGNGLFRKPASQSIYVAVESDRRRVVVGDLNVRFGADDRSMTSMRFNAEVEIKAASNVALEFTLSRNTFNRQLAWVANVSDPGVSQDPVSVFAERTTSDWNFTTRGSFVFARDLTLQIYLQLFSAKGTFANFSRMTGSGDFVSYSFGRPDFHDLVLNSNVVLRWEYLPGSTMYLVWSQARKGNGGQYRAPLNDVLTDLFSLPMTNVLLLKISYWMNF